MSTNVRPQKPQGANKWKPRKKVCSFCVDKVKYIDFKNVSKLRRYVAESGKILPKRSQGTCAHHQRMLSNAIKKAREIALLPFVGD
ncbi:MAG: 30S ribosomal protein S18 [Armatimonadetes bacterium]|nr:30S ribosomal protein S18 [Candidatus Hippobium faecium]